MLSTIREHKRHYNKPDAEFLCEQLWNDDELVVLRYVADRSYSVAEQRMAAGSITLGLYRKGEHYVFWKMLHPDGHLHGYLLHLCEPISIETDAVTYRDLMLDIWQEPPAAPILLDEDDLQNALQAEQINDACAAQALILAHSLLQDWPQLVTRAEEDLAQHQAQSHFPASGG